VWNICTGKLFFLCTFGHILFFQKERGTSVEDKKINELKGLKILEKYSFNIMPFWYIKENSDIPLLRDLTLVNIRSIKEWDKDFSLINVVFDYEKITSLLRKRNEFILQLSFLKKNNYSTNAIFISDGEMQYCEFRRADSVAIRNLATTDISGSKNRSLLFSRWQILNCSHISYFKKELRDLEIILQSGNFIIEFNTTFEPVGNLHQKIIFWEIRKYSR
jgi:hypothetical protein